MNGCVTDEYDSIVRSAPHLLGFWQGSTRAMCCVQWQQGRFVMADVNPAMVQWLAAPVEQLIQCNVDDVLTVDMDLAAYFWDALNGGQTLICETRITLADETPCWVSMEVIPVPQVDGAAPQLMVTFADISGYRQTERELTESVQTLQQVIDHIPFSIVWKDCDSVFRGYNAQFLANTGFESDETLVGKTDEDMPWTREETAWYQECDLKVIATNRPQLNIIESQLRADGTRAWLCTRKIPLHAADGTVNSVLVVIEDITERRTTELTLRQSEERFRYLFEGVSRIGMQIYDRHRRVVDWNKASEEIYGYTREEAMGRQLEDLIIPDAMRAPVIQSVEDWLHHGIPIPSSELTLRHKSGAPVDVFSSHVMLTNGEGEPEMYCLDLDIRDRKQAETALRQTQLQMMHGEKMSSLGKMVAGIAHEINNPISFIDGNLDHAKDYVQELLHLVKLYQSTYPSPGPAIQTVLENLDLDFLQADFVKLATSMQAGADRIRTIVDSLRNFSRLDEAGAKVVDIHQGLNSALTILRHRLQTTDVPIEVVKNYGSLPTIVCYPGPLNQVFMNVLTNAIDALGHVKPKQDLWSPRIEISTTQSDSGYIVISISDNGDGISEETKAQIFDPFFTTKPVGQGTGMGLAISYQIIAQQHQGQLLLRTLPGGDTCFDICLPMDLVESP